MYIFSLTCLLFFTFILSLLFFIFHFLFFIFSSSSFPLLPASVGEGGEQPCAQKKEKKNIPMIPALPPPQTFKPPPRPGPWGWEGRGLFSDRESTFGGGGGSGESIRRDRRGVYARARGRGTGEGGRLTSNSYHATVRKKEEGRGKPDDFRELDFFFFFTT